MDNEAYLITFAELGFVQRMPAECFCEDALQSGNAGKEDDYSAVQSRNVLHTPVLYLRLYLCAGIRLSGDLI